MMRIVLAALTSWALISFSCGDLLVGEPGGADNIAEFESAWSITRSVYPYFEFKGIDWDSIYGVYRPRAGEAKGDEIFSVLFDLLAELKDGHVGLRTKGGYYVQTYRPPRTVRDQFAFDPLVVRRYLQRELRLAGDRKMEYEVFPDNIGYVRLSTFASGDWIQEFHSILRYLRDTKGLIIDVRHNGGGSDNNVDVVVSRFIGAPLARAPAYRRGELQSRQPLQPRGPFQYANRVIVLINGVCFSATEHFIEMMKQLPAVAVIGDTTGGGSGAPECYKLPSGREIRVSTSDFRRYDGLPFEWNGVSPHIRVLQTQWDARAGRDRQLECALALLR